jgi:hypothetical protein
MTTENLDEKITTSGILKEMATNPDSELGKFAKGVAGGIKATLEVIYRLPKWNDTNYNFSGTDTEEMGAIVGVGGTLFSKALYFSALLSDTECLDFLPDSARTALLILPLYTNIDSYISRGVDKAKQRLSK